MLHFSHTRTRFARTNLARRTHTPLRFATRSTSLPALRPMTMTIALYASLPTQVGGKRCLRAAMSKDLSFRLLAGTKH